MDDSKNQKINEEVKKVGIDPSALMSVLIGLFYHRYDVFIVDPRTREPIKKQASFEVDLDVFHMQFFYKNKQYHVVNKIKNLTGNKGQLFVIDVARANAMNKFASNNKNPFIKN